MPTPDALLLLEDIPRVTEDLARSTILAGRRLLSESAAGIRSESMAPQTMLAIRRSKLKLRFYLERRREEVLFFFDKKQATLRPLEAHLQVILQAVPPPPPAGAFVEPSAVATGPAAKEVLHCRLMVPPFLFLSPTEEEFSRYAPDGTTADNGILLRVGPSDKYVLGIRNPESPQRAAAVYTAQTRQPLSSWSAEPFLALIETLRSWLAEGMKPTAEVEIALPSDPSAASDVHASIYYFVKAYQSLEAESARAQGETLPTLLASFAPRYETQEYAADIALCIDRKGYFATPQEREPVSIGMHMTIGRELGSLVVRIALSPPDFLIAGALRDAFLRQLRNGAPKDVLQALELQQGNAWTEFLDSAIERAVVFRTEHEKSKDTDAIVLPGVWRDVLRTVILRVTATVDMNAQPLSVKLSKIALLYDSMAISQNHLDDQTVTYFMRLAMAFKDWQSVVH